MKHKYKEIKDYLPKNQGWQVSELQRQEQTHNRLVRMRESLAYRRACETRDELDEKLRE